jgi:lysophospholipase L1-like esterase
MKKFISYLSIPLILIAVSVILYSFVSSQKQDKTDLFIVGDSTVKNGHGDGAGGLWGWGDPIAFHFDSTKVNVENHALGGTSSRSFQTRGLWKEVLDKVGPGDYVLIQFGHNDDGSYNEGRARASIKGIGNDSLEVIMAESGKKETVHTYGWYMRKYISDVKAKGAIPIIVSPIPRNDWNGDKIKFQEKSYPLWAKQVAEQEKVPFIDLHSLMIHELEKCGEDFVTGTYFFKRDHTHTTAKGAVLNAKRVAEKLIELSLSNLSEYIIKNPSYQFPSKKKLIIIGDSTVKNTREGLEGWGDEIYQFLDTSKIDVINRARGGRSSRTFYYEGLWKEALDIARPGDYLLMQFGHNDGGSIDSAKMRGSIKGVGNDSVVVTRPDGTLETVHSYGWYISKYIQDSKKNGVIPIVLSHIPRREWRAGKVERASETYGKWAREAAGRERAFFIDLNELVALKYEKIGQEKVTAEFFLEDHTHTTHKGAVLNAKTVAEGILQLKCCDLKDFVSIPK